MTRALRSDRLPRAARKGFELLNQNQPEIKLVLLENLLAGMCRTVARLTHEVATLALYPIRLSPRRRASGVDERFGPGEQSRREE